MITIWGSNTFLIIQYSTLALFTFTALLSTPALSLNWWLITLLAITHGILLFFWPVQRKYIFPFLAAQAAVITALTILDTNFMFLIFIFSGSVGILLPLRSTIVTIGGLSLLTGIVLISRNGLLEGILSSLPPTIGFLSVGYIFNLREQAKQEQENTQRLLDELRTAHQRLAEYSERVQEITLVEERNRLARELHDSVKQQAFAASAQIGAALSLIKSSPAGAEENLRKAEQLMDEIRSELAQIIQELRPPALEGRGLANALREWGKVWSQQSRIPLVVHAEGMHPLPTEIEQNLFRVVQEALSNISRHSGASRADVRLHFTGETLTVEICDDGNGFVPAQPSGGMGLRMMRERVEQMKSGKLEVHSEPGKGTKIFVQCTVDAGEQK